MAEYKILHIYSDLLDLYGDYTNVTSVRRALEQMGHSCCVHTVQLGEEIRPAGYDLVYIGHGKAKNLAAAAPHFQQYAGAVTEAVEQGVLFLVTGNARLLFGRSFETPDGREEAGIGLFDYHGRETGKVFTGDVLSHPVFREELTCYGFVNRTSHIVGENRFPLFRLIKGPGDSDAAGGTEGTLYKNFFGTWQMGPLLARNPELLRELLRRMTGDEYREVDLALQERALAITLAEFGDLSK